MKKISKYIVLALLAAATLPACSDLEKKLLTVDVIGKNTIEGFMKEYDGYVAASEGMHAEIRSFYPIRLKYAEIAGDLLNITASAEEGDRLLSTIRWNSSTSPPIPVPTGRRDGRSSPR